MKSTLDVSEECGVQLKSTLNVSEECGVQMKSTLDVSEECGVQMKSTLDEIVEKLPAEFLMQEIMSKVLLEDRTPYVVVAFQECERMNLLTTEVKRSLRELDLGLKVTPPSHALPHIVSPSTCSQQPFYTLCLLLQALLAALLLELHLL